jgi:hypothetical protein
LGYPHGKPPYFWVLQTVQHQPGSNLQWSCNLGKPWLFHICVR